MSLSPLSEQFADLRHYVRLLVDRTSDHRYLAEELMTSAEQDLRLAEAAASAGTTAAIDRARQLLCGHVQRTAAGAATARQFCVSARAQYAAACRLLGEFD